MQKSEYQNNVFTFKKDCVKLKITKKKLVNRFQNIRFQNSKNDYIERYNPAFTSSAVLVLRVLEFSI